LSRYTHPEPDQKILLEQLKLTLPGSTAAASALAESSWISTKKSLLSASHPWMRCSLYSTN
jgi:hypothetical protein